MPKSKRPTRPSQKAKANRLSNLQIGGIVILVLVVVAIIYAVVSNNQTTAAAQVSATSTAAAAQVSATMAALAQTTQQVAPTQPPSPAQLTAVANCPTPTTKQYSSAPAMTIDKTKQYFATVKLCKGGEFTIQLYPDKAPITVNSFVFLAREGFFNGVTFHRVLENFMAQGGDPTGAGTGGPGYEFKNEDSDLKFDKAGVVAMANAGRDTNGSQFFITFVPTPDLNGNYTIFGQVTSGMDVVNGITRRDPDTNPTFTGDAMQSVTITEK
jgi:cyclophilin family peptidyl-prolyl cis-trans isomerase